MSINVIGISGVARSGKDTACNILLARFPNAARHAFADKLKLICNDICMATTGISAFTKDNKEKFIIRPILVAAGCAAREVEPGYWIRMIRDNVELTLSVGGIAIIPDVRFENEANYVQKELKGFLVNVERVVDGHKMEPANIEESRNCPVLKDRADVQIVAHDLGALEEQVQTKVIPHLL